MNSGSPTSTVTGACSSTIRSLMVLSSDTGEHITDESGQLQYIPFPTCNETGRSLELAFGVEKDLNCTIDPITDSLFHLLEFYIHNDAPLTCRIPSAPVSSTTTFPETSEEHAQNYIPLIFALTGTLQKSHIHVSPSLNLLFHTSEPKQSVSQGRILAATGYSVPKIPIPASREKRANKDASDSQQAPLQDLGSPYEADGTIKLIINDPLPLRLSPHWYTTPSLPPSTTPIRGLGGHVHLSTVFYCLLSAMGGAMGALAYFRGVELPRRVRVYGKDRLGATEGGRGSGYAWPGNGYAAYSNGVGKRD